MHRRFVLAAVAAATLTACAPIASDSALSPAEARALRISEIDVQSSGANYLNSGARNVRNLLAPDLRAALRTEFSDRIVPSGGWTLQAEPQRLAVASSASTALGRDQSQLTGTLRVIDPSGTLRASVPIEVTAGEAADGVLSGAAQAVTNSRSRYYRQLLGAFAEDSRVVLLGRDLPGARLVRSVTR